MPESLTHPPYNSTPPVAPKPARPSGRILLIALLAVGGLVLGLLVVATIAMSQLDRMRPWVNDKVSEATGRRFEVQGPLAASWQWPQPLEDGWRRWIPGVTVHAEQLVMDNPAGFTPPFAGDDPQDKKGSRKAASKENKEVGSDASKPGSPGDNKNDNNSNTPRTPTTATQADSPTMASIDRATASVRLWPLLARHLAVDTVTLQHPEIALARTAHGTNNWTFKRKDEDAPRGRWTFDVDRLVITEGLLAYADGVKDLDLQAHVQTTEPTADQTATAAATGVASPASATVAVSASDTASAPNAGAERAAAGRYGLRFQLEGRYAKAKVHGSGQAGHVISLRDKVVDYPLQIALSAGSVAFSAEGILANPGALSGLDFDVALRGDSMADLYDVTGLVLPNTPAFKTRGRLTGSLEPERAVWEYTDFRGKVGESDLQGSLKYTSGKPRPRLTGTMTSNQLRLADLGPAIGTTKPDNTNRGRDQRGKVLPDAKFAAERWNAMDMDIVFKGRHIIRPESLPLEDLSLHAVMENAQLKLSPLTFGVAQGKIESEVSIDGRTAPLKAQIRGTVQGLQLSALFPKVELMKKSLGRMDGAVALASTGNSIGSLLGKGTGEMRLYVRDGTLSKQLLDLAALNVGSIIVGRLFGDDKEVHLRCAVADFTVVEGLATTRVVKMSTDDAVVEATGTIDLGTEEMNMRIKPESLEWKFLSLRSPLYVKGTFGNPDIGVEAGPLLLRAGAAVVAAVAAPAALALIPITVPAADDDTYCKPLLDLAKEPVQSGAKGAAGTDSQPARGAASRPGTPR
ncbi:MAG: AsmA family protein [Gammaproteobacteria bacterium]|nr:AsmA family protein [Gammaproteobacteria bacterium]